MERDQMATRVNASKLNADVDRTFDDLLGKLGCEDGRDANLISHWQDGAKPGFRIQVSRKSDGKMLTRFVDAEAA
jgi:hypothetical protein